MIIIIFIIIIIFCILNSQSENFKNIKTPKCCLIQKRLSKDNKFKYIYTPLTGSYCNYNNLSSNNEELYFDGFNNWNNETDCNDKSHLIGSCRHINKECVEFVKKDVCDKVKSMVWTPNVSCNDNIYIK